MIHNLVSKTLYTTDQERPDTCTLLALLTTTVREPNKDDWNKLVHLMKYIRKKIDLAFILSANDSIDLKWWIYASYAVHKNMRGHIGEGLYMGRGFTIVTLTNQKLNTPISIESDIVVVHNCMSAVCWTRYFMEAQGYQVMEKIFTKTTGAPFSWKRMGSHQVESSPSTSIFVSFSSLTVSVRSNWI